MRLSELASETGYEWNQEDIDISDIVYDSRRVQQGSLFCCIVGTFSDGHDYAAQAAAAGAAALLVQHKLPLDIPQWVVPNTRVAMAELAAAFWKHPEREMKFAGITGTNGKTTTTYMIKSIAEQAGTKVGLIGTIQNMIGNETIDTSRTTPESTDLFALLRQMKDQGVELVVMEVSSHSLDQGRVHGITFDVGEFTNLTQDHLDYHKTFENYLAAKKKLFDISKCALINADDSYAAQMMEGLAVPVITFGVRECADITAAEIDITAKGVQFEVTTPCGKTRLSVRIPGLFTVFNAMGAAAAALKLGYSLSDIKNGLERMETVSGRLEPMPIDNRDFSVFVDYAHTPDALENVLKTVRGFAQRRIITVFGCGGDRDRAKRPIMGEIAGRFSDLAIVTSDNPRTEDPFAILNAIEEGIKKSGCEYRMIESRRDAIKTALEEACSGDVVVIAGKGHENYQEIHGVKHHFDDKETVIELLKQLPL